MIPVLDFGEHEDEHGEYWVLVMPRADKSLEQHLKENGRPLEIDEALQILTHIASALAEINGKIVHRDLKPANVLLHDGVWKLADFGISRYAEESTAPVTRKLTFTWAYASPEQVEFKPADGAADVYSFGIIAYRLLSGSFPFTGPGWADFRHQHVTLTAPELTTGPVKLRSLIEECLRKPPRMRPSPQKILDRLKDLPTAPSQSGTHRLEELSHAYVRERSRQEAELITERERQSAYMQMFEVGAQCLERIAGHLATQIRGAAPYAEFATITGNASPIFRVEFLEGTLTFGRAQPVVDWDGPFSVIAASSVDVFSRKLRGWAGRSHSLWFCDPMEEGRFDWYELAFMDSPLRSQPRVIDPFAKLPHETNAFDNITFGDELDWPLTHLDPDDISDFLDRWQKLFADAAEGVIQRPSTMPERPAVPWRRK